MGEQTITTEITAHRTQEPEVAIIEGMVFAEADNPAAAEARVRDRISTVRESLTASTSTQVRTTALQVDEVDDMFGPETEADFRAEETFKIECPPDTIETTASEITAASGTVRGIEFKLYPTTHQQLEDKVIQTALERAREQAKRIAETEDVALAELESVTTTDAARSPTSIADELLADVEASGPTMNPVEVSKRVEVVYSVANQ
jgi:uncharacterized protein YggE